MLLLLLLLHADVKAEVTAQKIPVVAARDLNTQDPCCHQLKQISCSSRVKLRVDW